MSKVRARYPISVLSYCMACLGDLLHGIDTLDTEARYTTSPVIHGRVVLVGRKKLR